MNEKFDWINDFAVHPTFPTPDESHPVLASLVGISYLIQFVTVLLIMIQGYRHGSYGMPIFGVVFMLGICFICGFVGPAYLPHLFQRFLEAPVLLWLWKIWTGFMLVVFVQYVVTVNRHPRLWPELSRYAFVLSVLLLVLVTYGQWTFIIFFQAFLVRTNPPEA